MAKVVDKAELDKMLDMAEITMKECADDKATMSQRSAEKEPMHDVTSDEKKKGNKEAVADSEKGLNEVSLGKLVRYRKGAEQELGDIKHFKKNPGQYPAATSDDAKAAGRREKTREKGISLAHKKMTGKAKVGASAPKHPYMEETVEEGRMPASVIKHKQRIANMTPEEKAKKFAGKSEEQLKSMARRHGYGKDSNEYSKHGSFEKKEQIDEIKQSKEKRYDDIIKAFKTAPGQVGGQSTRERDAAISKHMGGDVHKGEIRRAMKRHFHTKGLMEDEQIDELKRSTVARYEKKAGKQLDTLVGKAKDPYLSDLSPKERKTANKRAAGIQMAMNRLEEKAPPGAKFERMVKHIKKGYSKDGLTAKEKSIAFATAWKAKKKEQMDEAMGSVKKASAFRIMKRKVSTQVKAGLGVEGPSKTIQVTGKNDPERKVRRISKDKFDPSKYVKV
jgi:hypothetical protein